jgi:hypothetical protein
MALIIFKYLSEDPQSVLQLLVDESNKENKPQQFSNVHESAIIEELKTSFQRAQSKDAKRQVLSVLVSQYTRAQVSKLLESNISCTDFQLTSLHRLHWGDGLPAQQLPFKHLKYNREQNAIGAYAKHGLIYNF